MTDHEQKAHDLAVAAASLSYHAKYGNADIVDVNDLLTLYSDAYEHILQKLNVSDS